MPVQHLSIGMQIGALHKVVYNRYDFIRESSVDLRAIKDLIIACRTWNQLLTLCMHYEGLGLDNHYLTINYFFIIHSNYFVRT